MPAETEHLSAHPFATGGDNSSRGLDKWLALGPQADRIVSPFDPSPRLRRGAGAWLVLAVPTVRQSKEPNAHELR
jgi:hypothetical protein